MRVSAIIPSRLRSPSRQSTPDGHNPRSSTFGALDRVSLLQGSRFVSEARTRVPIPRTIHPDQRKIYSTSSPPTTATALHQRLDPNRPAPQALLLAGTQGLRTQRTSILEASSSDQQIKGPDLFPSGRSPAKGDTGRENQAPDYITPHVYRRSASDRSDSTGSWRVS